MSQLGKRSRPPSMCRTPSTTALGSLCDIPSIVAPDQDPAALQLQQKEVVSAAAAVADPAATASGSARRQRQRQAQAQRHATGSAESGGPCFWPPALVSEKVSLQGGGFQGFAAAVAAVEPAQFLKACGLCTRRLGPGKDTYMYRGDMAFCSTECRDLRIALDERLASCSMASGATATTTAGAGSKATRTAA